MRRWRWVVVCVLAIVGVVAAVVWKPMAAQPRELEVPAIVLEGEMRTWEEHDAIYAETEGLHAVELPELLYLGFRHTSDPTDPQLAEARRLIAAFEPTVLAVEGRPGPIFGSMERLVRRKGESGMMGWMARESGWRIVSLEPSHAAEAAFAVDASDRKRAALFFFLRSIDGDRGRDWPMSESEMEGQLRRVLGRNGLDGELTSLEEVQALYSELYPEAGDWTEFASEALYPSAERGPLGEVAAAVNLGRDEHMMRVLVHLVRSGERVAASCGMSHTIRQEPVLRSTL